MRIPRILLLASIAVLFSSLIYGQGANTGGLHINVKDPQGNLVTNALVTVRDEAKGIERTAAGNGAGVYSAQTLPPGSYTVTVSAQGFATENAPGVVITVGAVEELPIKLTVATQTQTVSVIADAAPIETTRTGVVDTVNQNNIENLPINGRDYINFAKTDSQVVQDTTPSTGAAPTSGLNFNGQRGRSNLVNVDGFDATDNSVNGVRSTVSQEGVREFQIITNGYQPEYGRAAGGVVNIVTKSGENAFHGDVFGFLRNRDFQAVNPFAVCLNPPCSKPAYTRVQGGIAAGGALRKDKTFYFLSYEITRRHETGFSSIGTDNFGLVPFDTATTAGGALPFPLGTIQTTPAQASYLQGLTLSQVGTIGVPNILAYEELVGASSGMAEKGKWPALMGGQPGFITSCSTPGTCFVPASYLTLDSQEGNFPVFEGTSLYSLRIDHNINNRHSLTLHANVSPSTVTGIEVNGENQPFGQNSYSRTSEQTYRDVAGTAQERWIISNNKVNDFGFQYARRGLSYFYNTAIPAGATSAINIPGFANFGREPYSFIQRTEQRYQFNDNLSWTIGRHNTKLGADFNFIKLKAIFTPNYGGVYDFGSLTSANVNSAYCPDPANCLPGLSAVQAYGAGLPAEFVQGLGSPSDSFNNIPIGVYWQDSWQAWPTLTLNFGLRYDVEIAPKFKAPTGLAAFGYNYLGLQKGIQTDKNNIQPRVGLAWDPAGDKKTVIRASYGMFFDHPLLGLYFLGDASDGSTSGQLAFGGTGGCSGAGNPGNLNAIPIFQGLPINVPIGANPCAASLNPAVTTALGYQPNQQRFIALNFPQSIFLNQNYLNPATFMPLGFQPFGYPQGKNFVYAYSQQANLSVEHDLGRGYTLDLAYNFNGGRHLNRPINANAIRGDLMVKNFEAELQDAAFVNNPLILPAAASPFTVNGCNPPGGPLGPAAFVGSSLMNFFRPSGLNASVAGAYIAQGLGACVALAENMLQGMSGFNAACDPLTSLNGCIPFGDMDANFSNGTSVYHGFSANLRKQAGAHLQFLASYTWSHAIDDSTDLESTLTPQDSYFPELDRSNSTFDQRHRFVFSGVYKTGKVGGDSLGSKFLSGWIFAPLIQFASGRPFNIITSNGDNLQLSSLTGRPNTTVNPVCTASGNLPVHSKYSPTGVLQEPCVVPFVLTGTTPTLLQLDGNLGRNAGITPWTVFNDLRVAKTVPLSERASLELIGEVFNLANRYNVAAVSPLFTNAGQASAAYDPRQFQFGMKVLW